MTFKQWFNKACTRGRMEYYSHEDYAWEGWEAGRKQALIEAAEVIIPRELDHISQEAVNIIEEARAKILAL